MPLQILLLLALLVILAPASAAQRCIAVDGDTLVCNHRKIRLTNVYAAELNEAGGAQAKRRLQLIVSSGNVTWRSLGEDRYGRTLAEVYVNGRRIEQSDIGPRAGRGSHWVGDRHHVRAARAKRMRAPRRAKRSQGSSEQVPIGKYRHSGDRSLAWTLRAEQSIQGQNPCETAAYKWMLAAVSMTVTSSGAP